MGLGLDRGRGGEEQGVGSRGELWGFWVVWLVD